MNIIVIKHRMTDTAMFSKSWDEIQVVGQKCIDVRCHLYLGSALSNIIETRKRTSHFFPIPIAHILGIPYIEGK